MSWKLSVAEPIPRFDRGIPYQTTIDADVAAGAASVILAADNASTYLLEGDAVRLGPSSNASYVGKVEYKTVTSTGTDPHEMSFTEVLDNSYEDGDAFVGVGSATSEGWDISGSSDAILYLLGHGLVKNMADAGTKGTPLISFGSQATGQYLKKTVGTHDDIIFGASLFGGKFHSLLDEVYYRLGGYVFFSSFTGTTATLELVCSGGTTVLSVSVKTAGTSWQKFESTANVHTLAATIHTYVTRLRMSYDVVFPIGGIDCLYLTHAHMTSGYASGVYTLPCDPSGGVTGFQEEQGEHVSGFLPSRAMYSYTGIPYRVRGYRLVFDAGDALMVRNLEVMQYWQNMGHTLMLESDITGDRPIFGLMDYNFSYQHWDDSRLQISMSFVGV